MHRHLPHSRSLLNYFGQITTRKLIATTFLAPLLSTVSCSKYPALRFSHNFSSMQTCLSNTPPVEHPKFDVLKHDLIEEYNILATLYLHKDTSAHLLSYSTPESELEKVFMIGFKTPPVDNTGAAHIVEHSVLNGSKKYPVKEPFVELLKGSLKTFLNAWTFPECTFYPIASTNIKDFYNLADVYMDAVFHPRAMNDPDVLKQEGTRLSVETVPQGEGLPDKEKIIYSGVVFNEMKAMNNEISYLTAKEVTSKLFPESPYQYNSGGNPKFIKELTFEKFKNFYQQYYHPGNSNVIFWGSDDVYDRLQFIDSHFQNVTKVEGSKNPKINLDVYNGEPQHIVIPSPTKQGKLEDSLIVAWGLNSVLENNETLSYQEKLELNVLSEMMLRSSVSELYQALMNSQLGTDVHDEGYDPIFRKFVFSVGLNGIKQDEDAPKKVENIIMDTLKKCYNEGFSTNAIESSINKLEFSLKECTYMGSLSKGLTMTAVSAFDLTENGDPVEFWKFDQNFATLRSKLQNGEPVFQNLIKKYLLDNKHMVVLHFKADKSYIPSLNEEEESSLDQLQSTLTPEQIETIKADDANLKLKQATPDTPEALETIPSLNLEDLSKQNYEIPTEVMKSGNNTILLHDLPTAGILYASLCFNMDALSIDDFKYLPLFCMMIEKAGTDKLSEIELTHFIDSHTGGIDAGVKVFTSNSKMNTILDPNKAEGYFVLSGKATVEKVDKLFDLFLDVLKNTSFSNKKVALERLKVSLASHESAASHSGDSYGVQAISAASTPAGYADEQMGGISYLFTLKELVKQAENDWDSIEAKLQEIKNKLINSNSLLVNLTSDMESLKSLTNSSSENDLSKVGKLIESFPSNQAEQLLEPKWLTDIKENNLIQKFKTKGFAVDTQVNYVCLGGKLYETGSEVSFGKNTAFTLALIFGYLWDSVRVLGGAYGVRFKLDKSGNFYFSSYRDPNLSGTLKVYKNTSSGLSIPVDENGAVSGGDKMEKEVADKVKKAIIGAIGHIDNPKSFESQGKIAMWNYITNETAEERQKLRDDVLSLTYKDFNEFATVLENALTDSNNLITAIFSSEEALNQYKQENPNLEIIKVTETSNNSLNSPE